MALSKVLLLSYMGGFLVGRPRACSADWSRRDRNAVPDRCVSGIRMRVSPFSSSLC